MGNEFADFSSLWNDTIFMLIDIIFFYISFLAPPILASMLKFANSVEIVIKNEPNDFSNV